MDYYENLQNHQIELPAPAPKGGLYAKFTSLSNSTLYYSSGVGCKRDGEYLHIGHVGSNISLEQAQEAAEQCILNIVSNMQEEFGNLNKVKKILKMTGYVSSAENFGDQHIVMDRASACLEKIFGKERGSCARTALGVSSLPGHQAVEIELVFEIKSE